MLRASIPLGRLMNVELRANIFIPLLLIFAVAFSVYTNGGAGRGIALWLAMCFAILVREIARSIAVAYAGLTLRAILLLPVGGLMALSGPGNDKIASATNSRLLLLSGPIANFVVGLLLLGTSYALEPHVSLLAQPWISTTHILRSFVWLQIILGAVNLLPTPSTARALKPDDLPSGKAAKPSLIPIPSFSLGTGLALALVVLGIALVNIWFIILGGFLLLGAQMASAQTVSSTDAESILVREVMLTEYTLLSSSDTLQGALDHTIHSLQDVFPIVRGDRLVGSIARQTIAERLLTSGDSYLQGIMSRSLQLASPTDKLVEALRRAANLGAGEFIPVVQADGANFQMIGILTPQSLARAVQQVKGTRPLIRETNRD